MGHLRPAVQVNLFQKLRRNIHRLALGQGLRQLLRPHNRTGQHRRVRSRLGLGQGRGGTRPPHRRLGQGGFQALQSLPPQGVHGAGRQHQPLLQFHPGVPGPEHGAAGFFQPGLQFRRRQCPVPGLLRGGTLRPDGVSPGAGRQGYRLPGPQGADHVHRYPAAVLPAVPGLGPGKQLLGLRGVFRPGAEHLRPGAPLIVSVGEAAAGEGGLQLPGLLPAGSPLLIQQTAIDPCDHRHIFRPLHAALQLQARHAHLFQLLHIVRQVGVLQAQGMASGGLFVDAVGQAAGLGAGSPVAAASADHGAHFALTRVAHAQGPVPEHLDFRGTAPGYGVDVPAAQLPGQHHPLQAQLRRPARPAQGVQAHLSAGVEGNIGRNFPGQPPDAPVLDENGVHPHVRGFFQGLGGGRQLPVRHQGVQGQIHLHPPQMAVGHGLPELLVREIPGAAPGVEPAEAHVHGVCPVLHGGHHGLPAPGGAQQLHHWPRPCWALNSWRFSSEASFLAWVASSR